MKRFLTITIVLLVLMAVGCDMDALWNKKEEADTSSHALVLSSSNITTDVSESKVFTISASTFDKDGKVRGNTSINWSFSVPEKIAILHKGKDSIMFSVSEPGRIVLTAFDESNAEDTQAVVITATGALRALYLSENNVTLGQKEEHKLSITYNPDEPSDRAVVWSSSDTAVVQVVKTSETEAVAIAGIPGKATITVSGQNNTSIKATCLVTVSVLELPKTDARYLRLSDTYLTFDKVSDTANLTATIFDGNNLEFAGTVLWESSNPDIVSVSSIGKTVTVAAHGIGSASIVARVEGKEEITGTCEVTVAKALTGLTLTKIALSEVPGPRSKALTAAITGAYPVGETVAYQVGYIPYDATEKSVTWSRDSDIIDIESRGDYVIVYAKRAGNTKVIATANSNPTIQTAASLGIYNPSTTPDNSIQKIVVAPSIVELEENQNKVLSAEMIMQDGTIGYGTILWNTSSETVTVTPLDSSGSRVEVRGNKEGNATVTATALANPYVSGSAVAYVYKEGEVPPSVQDGPFSLVSSYDSITLVAGKSSEVLLHPYPTGTLSGAVLWTTGNETVATVEGDNRSAVIHAVSPGETLITARCADPQEATVSIRVRVVGQNEAGTMLNSITLSDTAITLDPPFREGQKCLTASSTDSNGSPHPDSYTWTISDPTILSGSNTEEGFSLTPLKPGTAVVTARSNTNSTLYATCRVLVNGSISSIQTSCSAVTITVGESLSIDALLTPSDTIERDVSWSISGSSVDMVSNDLSTTVTGKNAGKSTITVTSNANSSIKASCIVSVEATALDKAEPRYLTLSDTYQKIQSIGGSSSLTARIYDGNGSEYNGNILWESSDPQTVTVSGSGKSVTLLAQKAGSAIIKAWMEGREDISGSCEVSVSSPLEALTLTKVSMEDVPSSRSKSLSSPVVLSGSYPIGERVAYKVGYVPYDTSEKGVEWSKDSNIISMEVRDEYVILETLDAGNATITATSTVNPSISASAAVSIYDAYISPDNSIRSLTVSPSVLNLETGKGGVILTASIEMQDGSKGKDTIIWTTSDSSVSLNTLDSTGSRVEVYGMEEGRCTITATSLSNPHVSGSSVAYVYREGEIPPAIQEDSSTFTLIPSYDSVTQTIGEKTEIELFPYPEGSAFGSILWTVGNPSIATLKESGNKVTVTAKAAGETIVSARCSNPKQTEARIKIRVIQEEEAKAKVSSITLSQTSLSLNPPFSTAQASLEATSSDSSGTRLSDTYTWTIADPSILQGVWKEESYQLTPLKPGTTEVRVKSNSNPSLFATCLVTVQGGITGIQTSYSSVTISVGEELKIDAFPLPSNTIQKEVVWSVTGSSVDMSSSGLTATVRGVSPGKATITATSKDNSAVKTECTITVGAVELAKSEPRYLSLSDNYKSFKYTSGSASLTAMVYDGNGLEYSGNILWKSSNPQVVSVSGSNKSAILTVHKTGNATITAWLEGRTDIAGICEVTVATPLSALTLTKVSVEDVTKMQSKALVSPVAISGAYPVGERVTYKVGYVPYDTSEKGVSWTRDSNIIDIEENGDYVIVTMKEAGNANVVATSVANPNISVSAALGIYEPSSNPDNAIRSLSIKPAVIELEEGKGGTILSASLLMQDGTTGSDTVLWNATGDSISLDVLDSSGSRVEVLGIKEGRSLITATSLSNPYVSGSAVAYVYREGETPSSSSRDFSIIPDYDSITLVKGKTSSLELNAYPSGYSIGSVLWTTGDPSVATVSGSGDKATITAVGKGSTTITARCSVPAEASTTIRVKVIDEAEASKTVSSIVLSDTSLTMNPPFKTDQTGLTAISFDALGNEMEDTYIWSVDKNGILSGRVYNNSTQYILTAIKPGTVTVRVQSVKNPSITASATIMVTGGLEQIQVSPSILKLGAGESVSVVASLIPANTVEGHLSWNLSGDAVSLTKDPANEKKAVIKGLKAGNAVLTVSSLDNPTIRKDVSITVFEADGTSNVSVGSVELSATTLSIAPPISTPSILTATVYDDAGLIFPTGVSWEIMDNTIAEFSTMDSERVAIVAKKAGETRIVARSITDPSVYKTCILTVSGKITKITPATTFVTMVNGSSTELKVTLNPTDTIETELIWTTEGSTDGSTTETPWVSLRPTASGCLITALKTGETTVRVSSSVRPEIYADIAILVTEPPKAMATITLTPTPVELSPTSNRLKVTANVKPIGDSVIDEEVVFSIDPVGLVDTTVGGSNEIYLIPNGMAGEGTIYASLPSYPHIEAGKARLFVGGQLRSLSADGVQSVAVNVGDTVPIGIVYNPENTTETGIIWSSSNDAVARVNGGSASDAIVTGVSAGSATITATSRHYPEKYVEFTVVVKSIITEVAFTDQYDNQGLIFTTDTETPLHLACKISPDIERSLVYKPKSNSFAMATLSKQDGTINDVIFTPDPASAGTYEYNITYDNRIIDVLSINTVFKGLAINSTREVFTPGYAQKQLVVSNDNGQLASDQVKWSSSDTNVVTVSSEGLLKAKNPGEAIVIAKINGGMSLQTKVYVNVDIPASFEKALRTAGYLPVGGDTILPSQLDTITTLDFRNLPSTLAVDLSGIQKLKNLKRLYLNGIKLDSDTLNLHNSPYLEYVDASNTNIKAVTSVPKNIKTFIATGNILTSFSFLGSTTVEVVNLSGNSISSYTNMSYATDVNLSNNNLTSLSLTSDRIQKLNVSGNNISSVNITSSSLRELNLSSNNLWYNNLNLNNNANLKTPSLEVLNLNNNHLGLYKDKPCPTCNGATQGANSATYEESETQNREQPLRTINVNWLPNLKELYLQNNHIRSGLSAADKGAIFNVTSGPLVKVDIRGNHIGNYYNFQNHNVRITSLPASSTYTTGGLVINYDHGGCFYTGRTWNDYWTWLLKHKQYYDYWIGMAYTY